MDHPVQATTLRDDWVRDRDTVAYLLSVEEAVERRIVSLQCDVRGTRCKRDAWPERPHVTANCIQTRRSTITCCLTNRRRCRNISLQCCETGSNVRTDWSTSTLFTHEELSTWTRNQTKNKNILYINITKISSSSAICCCVWKSTRGQSNLTKSASRGAHSPVSGHSRGSKVVPLNSWGTVSY